MRKKDIFTKIAVFTAIALFITSQVLPRYVNNLDELWNFNFANCIANGLVPYKDFNIIQGPLMPLFSAIFLIIFGKEMIVMRFIAVLLDTAVLYMTYKIMEKLEIKKYLKYIIILVLVYIMRPYFAADYNWFICLNILVLIYMEISKIASKKDNGNNNKNVNKNWKYHILIGLIAGISISIKQTIGLIIVVGLIGYKLLEVRNIKDFKEFLKIAILRTVGALIIPGIMFLVLLKLGAFKDYIDYCIMGVTTFSNKITYIDGLVKNSNILIKALSIIVPFVYITLIYMNIKRKDSKALILFVFSVISMILVYPISDSTHFVVAIVPTLISIGYIIFNSIKKAKISEKEEQILNSFFESFIIIISVIYFILGLMQYNSQNINKKLDHFKYLPMEKNQISNIKDIEEYIKSQEKTVYIIDSTAALYMIPINRYNKNFDMFLNGNLGSRGEKGQIDDLEKMEEKIVLIMKEDIGRNWQNPEMVRKYITTQMKKTGEIGIFDIYE